MQFAKPFMTISELEEMGLDRTYLKKLTHIPNQDFCWKKNPLAQKSTILFDTERLQQYFDRQIKLQGQLNKH